MSSARKRSTLRSSSASSRRSSLPSTPIKVSRDDARLDVFSPHFDIDFFNSNGNGNANARMDESDNEHIFKILLLGSEGSGKTTILNRFVQDASPSVVYEPTRSVNVMARQVVLKDERDRYRILCQVWDTMGVTAYMPVTLSYIKSACAFVICYDASSRQSFEDVEKWMTALRQRGVDSEAVFILAACRHSHPRRVLVHYDLHMRVADGNVLEVGPSDDDEVDMEVTRAEADAFARAWDMLLVECDAGRGMNTAEVFGLAVAKAFAVKYEQLYKERQRKKFQAKISIAGVRRVFEALEQRSREQDGRELTEEEQMRLADEAERVLREEEETSRRKAEDEASRRCEEEQRRTAEEEQRRVEARQKEEKRMRQEEDERGRREEQRAADHHRVDDPPGQWVDTDVTQGTAMAVEEAEDEQTGEGAPGREDGDTTPTQAVVHECVDEAAHEQTHASPAKGLRLEVSASTDTGLAQGKERTRQLRDVAPRGTTDPYRNEAGQQRRATATRVEVTHKVVLAEPTAPFSEVDAPTVDPSSTSEGFGALLGQGGVLNMLGSLPALLLTAPVLVGARVWARLNAGSRQDRREGVASKLAEEGAVLAAVQEERQTVVIEGGE